MNGKGSRPRTFGRRFWNNFDAVFGAKDRHGVTGRYVWDPAAKQFVKQSSKIVRAESWEYDDKPFAQKVIEGYRRVEERGERYKGKAANIKRIWGVA